MIKKKQIGSKVDGNCKLKQSLKKMCVDTCIVNMLTHEIGRKLGSVGFKHQICKLFEKLRVHAKGDFQLEYTACFFQQNASPPPSNPPLALHVYEIRWSEYGERNTLSTCK